MIIPLAAGFSANNIDNMHSREIIISNILGKLMAANGY
jgi:hypothetical protein